MGAPAGWREASRRWALLTLLLVACADPGADQVVHTTEACPVALDPTLTLSGPEVDHTWTVAADPDRVYLRPAFARHQVSVFDRDGELVDVLGAEGEGPGEFQTIRAILPLEGGELLVLDGGNARTTRLTSSGGVVSTTPLPVRPVEQGAELLPDGSLLVAGRARASREHIHYSLFHLSRDGEILAGFGLTASPDRDPRFSRHTPRRAAPAPDGTVWSVDTNSPLYGEPLTLYRWTLDGELLDSARLERDWFVPLEADDQRGVPERRMRLPPETSAADIKMDAQGRLWILALVPDPEWEDADFDDRGRWHDSVLEVWDPATRTSLCQIRRDEYFVRFVGDGELASYRLTPRAHPRLTVWQTGMASSEP